MKNKQTIYLSSALEEDTEFIPLMTNEEEEQMNAEQMPAELPILPLRNTVLFPGVVIPITVGRDKSIKLLRDAHTGNKTIGVVSQKDDKVEDPSFEELNTIGTVAHILRIFRMPDGNTTVIIQGKRRFQLVKIIQKDPYLKAEIIPIAQPALPTTKEFEAIVSSIKDMALQIIQLSPHIPSEANIAIKNIESPVFLINFIASNMNAEVSFKQQLLEVSDVLQKANMLISHMSKELQMLQLKSDIQSRVRTDIDKQQREYFLHQQMRMIQEELGGSPQEIEIKEFKEKAEKKKWPAEAKKRFEKEIEKLQRMNPMAAEYSIQVNYIETLLDLPWESYSKDIFDLKKAQKILNRDHYGLEKVKERIIEHLAVLKLKGDMKAPILCLYGPPGVGKTSLGKSVAEALGRKYIRMSLGGLKDEAEIRGHRKTYIGAMPGRILQNMKKAGTSNPVFVLDEIDKVGNDFHGDPSSALLEVLDPEQNNTFYDNFLELDYDLSKVLFLATANSLSSIHPALRDRMEIIEINGYTIEEKLQIAKHHLIPKLIKEHGIKQSDIKLSDAVLEKIAIEHTRESGVRLLEKKIAKIVRHVAKNIAMKENKKSEITLSAVDKILGPGHSLDKYQGNDVAGVVTGLAWTSVGGDILFIEVSLSKGKGKLTLTGNLGEVMKESAMIALQYIKANAKKLNIKPAIFDTWDVHVHVPEGATPKDGPSAGITMLTALVSAFTQRKVKSKLAMTGEITLRGRVLAVGGIKEKILAARRAGITEIILSEENKKDILEIKPSYLKGLKFQYVKNMHEVISKALTKEKVKEAIDFS
ncbi:MAG: endopeptidase La [Bacteroidetes bacterium]|nr:endopeptidase La [Bacteroidota bacterium]MBV6461991.1 Lon protease 2 [Flavobacteriales bacterium]WKZ76614.1 MAG: endopeptidase La [Vicingaceae bacterium]MCL4815565.1 endopeptidase La [Flavobacteriales bacterium]NOG94297.1 endopeptidase La [Bacteroidota bacterium]